MSETPVNKAGSFHVKRLLAGVAAIALLLVMAIWLATLGSGSGRAESGSADANAEVHGSQGDTQGKPAVLAVPSPAGTAPPSTAAPGVSPTNVSGDPGALRPTGHSGKVSPPSFRETLPTNWPKGPTTGCAYVSVQLEASKEAVDSDGVDAVRGLLAPMEDLQGDPAAAKVSQDFDSIRRLWSTAVSEADNGDTAQKRLVEADKLISSVLTKLKCS